METDYEQMASERVEETPALFDYTDLLLNVEYDDQAEHWKWLATADLHEVLDWCVHGDAIYD